MSQRVVYLYNNTYNQGCCRVCRRVCKKKCSVNAKITSDGTIERLRVNGKDV